METAPARLTALESRIAELFSEPPRKSGRWPSDATLAGETYQSLTGVTTDAAQATLRSARDATHVEVPVDALYPTLSTLLHPTATAVLAYADHQGDRISFPQYEPTFLHGATLTILAVWRGVFHDLLDYFGWEHPDLPVWSEELDAAIIEILGPRPTN